MKLTIGHLYPDLPEPVRRQRKHSVPDETLPVARNRGRDNCI